MSKKLIISGATSMIGSAIVRCALEKGLEVFAIVRRGSEKAGHLPNSDGLTIINADLSDYKNLELDAYGGAFFHLAWERTHFSTRDDTDAQWRNIGYTLDTLRLAHRAGCAVFIGAGSQAEYGVKNETLRSDTSVDPESGYGIAKYSAGKLSRLLARQLGIRHHWFRILSVFGPGDSKTSFIMTVINGLKDGTPVELTKCEQIWDYLYVEDAARAFLAAAKYGKDGAVYPLGSGDPHKMCDYAQTIRALVNPAGEIVFGAKPYYPHQAMRLEADISELTRDTDWRPEVSFEEGIRRIASCL